MSLKTQEVLVLRRGASNACLLHLSSKFYDGDKGTEVNVTGAGFIYARQGGLEGFKLARWAAWRRSARVGVFI